jgi:hypothetical protein
MSVNLTNISKLNIMSIPFDGNIDIEPKADSSLARVSGADMRKMPTDNEKTITLRKKVQSLFFDKIEGSYAKLEYLAQIKQNTFQKWMNGSRNISRKELAKFVVGLSVDIELADELFVLYGHALNCDNNRFDCVVANAIKDKDDIAQFGEDVETYCNMSLF